MNFRIGTSRWMLISFIVLLALMLAPGQAALARTSPTDNLNQLPAGLAPAYLEALAAGDPAYAVDAQGIAQNPAQGFGAAFDEAGMTLDGADWSWGISLRAAGREGGGDTTADEGKRVATESTFDSRIAQEVTGLKRSGRTVAADVRRRTLSPRFRLVTSAATKILEML